MTKTILFLRRVSQAFFFGFLVYLILHTAFPLDLKIPVDLFLRLDPFIGLITLLTGKGVIERMLPAFGVLLLVIIFGNFFCGWFCPMGATIDFFDRFLFREKKRSKPFNDQPLRRLRYGVFLFALAAGVTAWQLLYLLDPISLITRTLVISIYPPAIFVLNNLIPRIQGLLPGNSTFLSTLPLPLFKVNLFIFAVFIVILALGVVRKRFWCRYLCPLGTLFSLTSRLRLFRRSVTDACTGCQKCVRDCPVGAIPQETPQHCRQQDCISCFKCLECPPKAVSFHVESPRWKTVEPVSLSRRYVLGSLAFGFFSALTIKTNPLQTESGLVNNRLTPSAGLTPRRGIRLHVHGVRPVPESLPEQRPSVDAPGSRPCRPLHPETRPPHRLL